ncbi:hypothetical protein GHT06_012346 [Daphnia sinensis]|uniref:Uncharacterized protein n=1 Tax=Daphnia sinensis TaxID=1820382 RepID=A0AAD5PYR8_9CRUS|nr:hypothetical protein GHT06_012346 [Daphnia sinensis]
MEDLLRRRRKAQLARIRSKHPFCSSSSTRSDRSDCHTWLETKPRHLMWIQPLPNGPLIDQVTGLGYVDLRWQSINQQFLQDYDPGQRNKTNQNIQPPGEYEQCDPNDFYYSDLSLLLYLLNCQQRVKPITAFNYIASKVVSPGDNTNAY